MVSIDRLASYLVRDRCDSDAPIQPVLLEADARGAWRRLLTVGSTEIGRELGLAAFADEGVQAVVLAWPERFEGSRAIRLEATVRGAPGPLLFVRRYRPASRRRLGSGHFRRAARRTSATEPLLYEVYGEVTYVAPAGG